MPHSHRVTRSTKSFFLFLFLPPSGDTGSGFFGAYSSTTTKPNPEEKRTAALPIVGSAQPRRGEVRDAVDLVFGGGADGSRLPYEYSST